VSESLAEFVNSACTKQADVATFIEANQIPSNCRLHNSERALLIPKYYHHRIDYNRIHQIVVDIHQYILTKVI
jgi:hypothetical protein